MREFQTIALLEKRIERLEGIVEALQKTPGQHPSDGLTSLEHTKAWHWPGEAWRRPGGVSDRPKPPNMDLWGFKNR